MERRWADPLTSSVLSEQREEACAGCWGVGKDAGATKSPFAWIKIL